MSASRKVTDVTTHYRLERKDKAGRWMPVVKHPFINYSSTIDGIKDEVTKYNIYRRNWSQRLPALPKPRRIARITTHITKVITRERVK